MKNENELFFADADLSTAAAQSSDGNSFDPDSVSIEGEGFYVSTGELASKLNMNRDLVRNHIRDFEEFFDVAYTKEGKGGHIRFPSSQIDLLETIIMLRKTKSVENVKEILRDPGMPFILGKGERAEKHLGLLLAENNKRMVEALDQAVRKAIDEKVTSLIEAKDSITQEQKDALDEVLEQNKELAQQNREMHDVLERSAQQLQEVQESNQQLREQMQELLEKASDEKKRGFFSFFKK